MAACSSRDNPVDVFLPLEVREFGNRLYKPISSSLRIKYSCFAVSSQLIVLGANTGAVYVFVKDSLSYISFIPNKERDIQIVRFSPDGKCIAIAAGCGVIIVWELNISNLQSSKKILEVTEHRGSRISDMVWDNKGQQLFVGDTSGKVTVSHIPGVLPRTVLSSTGGIRLRKPGIILICETPVVQLDYDNDHLLVSCRHKSAVMNLKREGVVSVGSQERDGQYGACFYRSTHVLPQHTQILSARPKARIWKASLDGKVELTYKLKDLLDGVGMTPIYGMSFKSEAERFEQEAPGSPSIFNRIRVINDHLVVWNANTLYILNLLSNTITQHSLVEDIQDLHVFENDVWIILGEPLRVRCLSLLHYNQLFKSLSQLQLHSQITEIMLLLSETPRTETADLSPVVVPVDMQYVHNTTNEQDEAPDPSVRETLPPVVPTDDNVSSDRQETEESTVPVTLDKQIDYNLQQETSGEESNLIERDVIQSDPESINTDLNETIIPSEYNIPSEHLPSYAEQTENVILLSERDDPVLTSLAATSQQCTEIEAVYSPELANSSFDESNLPFPKASRIRKTHSLKEGEIPSSWSPKLVRKRSNKERSNGGRESKTLSQSQSENELFDSITQLDLFANDIFQDTLIGPDREKLAHSVTLPELEGSPISQHIPRSERKKKQKKRDSKPQIPLTPNNTEQTHSPNRTNETETDPNQASLALAEHSTDSTAHEHSLVEKVHGSTELSTKNQVYEQFIQTSQKTWDELESGENDFLSASRFLSSWLTSFITLLTSVPATSLPGSHTISSLTSLSSSPHYQLLQRLATYAMLAGGWLSLSFPNPLLPPTTASSSDSYNFFYLQAIFLPLREVRSYLTEQQLQVDRSKAYSLYIKGLEDFKGILGDFSNAQIGSLLDIESQSFPLEIKGNIQSQIGFCVHKFPCLLPWEICTILFGNNDSPQLLKLHKHSQVFLEYMEELFLSAQTVPSYSSLLSTVFSTDHKSFVTWCCLSLSFLPSTAKLTVNNNLDIPMSHSHQLNWRYKQVWELILNWHIIGPDLAKECIPYFKQHCFWLGLISAHFLLDCKEKATPLLLHLRDISLIEELNQIWGKYPDNASDWKLTIESFLTIFVDEFEDVGRRDEAKERFFNLFRVAITEIGYLAGIELLRVIISSLEKTTNINTWFPYELFLKLVTYANIEKEKGKIAFTLLERLDEELWKQKPSAISLQFLSQEQHPANESVHGSLKLESSSFQWGIRIKKKEFKCQSCHIDFTSPLPMLPSDIQVFACGHCFHKACLVEGVCILCFSESQ